jgi:hypothetical protein
VPSVADLKNISHGLFLRICLILGREFSIISNKLNIEDRTQKTEDRMKMTGIGISGSREFIIGDPFGRAQDKFTMAKS